MFSPLRGYPAQVDVILDDTDITGLKVEIDGACRIRKNQGADAEKLEYVNRHPELFKAVPFIMVEPPCHAQHTLVSERAAHELAGMSRCCGDRKARDIFIEYLCLVCNLMFNLTETGTENDTDGWRRPDPFSYLIRDFPVAFIVRSFLHLLISSCSNNFLIVSSYGGFSMPFSVTIPVMRLWSVTSNAGL